MKGLFLRLLSWCPGAVGFFLRQKIYPRLFASCGRGGVFGRFIEIENPDNIHLGAGVVVSNRVRLRAGRGQGSGRLFLGDKVFVGIASRLFVEQGDLILKDLANIGSECRIVSRGGVTVGCKTLLAAFCEIDALDIESPEQTGEIAIGDDVWLGARSKVKGPAVIGNGTIIGAHAVVRGLVAPSSIAMGNPVMVIRSR